MSELAEFGNASDEPRRVKSKSLDTQAVIAGLRETVYSWSIPSDRLEWAQGADVCLGLSTEMTFQPAKPFLQCSRQDSPQAVLKLF